MAGGAITTASALQCPHGGTVTISSTNIKALAGPAALALATDSFVVAGCPFQIPAVVPIPSPCITVQWLVPDVRTSVGGVPTLSASSVGLCLAATQVPQGPVVVNTTQTITSTQ